MPENAGSQFGHEGWRRRPVEGSSCGQQLAARERLLSVKGEPWI